MITQKEVIFHVNTNGFIESGKITFIKDLLVQEHFNTVGINLVLVCEECDENYDEFFCTEHNVIIKNLESENEFTVQNIKRIAEDVNPQQIIIEFNRM